MKQRLMLALAPAALALSTVAYAQHAARSPGTPGAPPAADMRARHEAMMKQHAEDLKIVLRLRPDQEPALAALVAAHHPDEMRDMDEMGPAEPQAQTTPERLDRMAAMAAEQEKMRQALAKFYAVLSPEQQKVFDALMRLQGPHGPRGMHGDKHMMMGHGM